MFVILRFRVVISCGVAPRRWRSAAESTFGLESRKDIRAIRGKHGVCWSWSVTAAGCQNTSGIMARQGAASLVPAHSSLLGGRAILVVVAFPLQQQLSVRSVYHLPPPYRWSGGIESFLSCLLCTTLRHPCFLLVALPVSLCIG